MCANVAHRGPTWPNVLDDPILEIAFDVVGRACSLHLAVMHYDTPGGYIHYFTNILLCTLFPSIACW